MHASDVDPRTVPGMFEAEQTLHAVQRSGHMPPADQLSAVDIHQLVWLVMVVTRPYVQAELLADLSDQLAEDGQESFSSVLDHAAAQLRRERSVR